MTPLLKRLEQKGMIKRELLANNERQKNIVLTDKGRELSKLSGDITNKVFCATGLTEQQANDLMTMCSQITQNNKVS